MKFSFKRALSLFLIAVMMMSLLSGCSKKKDAASGSETPATTEAAVQEDVIALRDPLEVEALGSGTVKWSEETTADGYNLVKNEGGATLTYSTESGVKLVQHDGFAFKDLNRNNLLDQYEDWREPNKARAMDLARLLPKEDIAGLMLYSAHNMAIGAELSEDQIAFLDNGGRSMLNAASAATNDVTAQWNNALQLYAEKSTFGVPVITSTDPRNTGISYWPSNLALAATFDPAIAAASGETISSEYRLLGIATLLGPQIDLATEPRWVRVQGTFGEDPALARDMTSAFVNGIQSTFDANGEDLGWGSDSMNAMIKHWPGDGAAEGGRESHAEVGNATVYPGGQFETHFIPFVDGGLKLEGKTGEASSVMSSYSIAFSETEEYGELIGSAYSTYKIKDILRGQYGFEGVICTDWGVINDYEEFIHTSWGAFDLTKPERVYKILTAGVDQFGGHNSSAEIIEAYDIGVADIGEDAMRARFEESAVRLLNGIFQVGLFENAYTDVNAALTVAGSAENQAKGFDAQLKSVVMLKNTNDAIKASTSTDKPTVYIPMIYKAAQPAFFGPAVPASWVLPVDIVVASEYFNVITDKVATTPTGPADADGKPTVTVNDIVRATPAELAACTSALVVIDGPSNEGAMFTGYGFNGETQTYRPMSLQFGKYIADSEFVRKESLSGAMKEESQESAYGAQKVMVKENRSYFGAEASVTNSANLDNVLYAAANMPETATVTVALRASGSVIVSEFEKEVDAILVGFGIQDKALFEVAAGKFEPSGLLPVQFAKDMLTVEKQFEDVPRDMECYVDSEGNTYDFAFGMNYSGVIKDARTEKYGVAPLVTPTNTGK